MSISFSRVLWFVASGMFLSGLVFFLLVPHRIERIAQYFSAVFGG